MITVAIVNDAGTELASTRCTDDDDAIRSSVVLLVSNMLIADGDTIKITRPPKATRHNWER